MHMGIGIMVYVLVLVLRWSVEIIPRAYFNLDNEFPNGISINVRLETYSCYEEWLEIDNG